MEVFTISSALYLNMGYYHIKLDADAQKLSTIVFPRDMGKIQVQTLTGVSRLPQMFFKTSFLSSSKI
jgi:hypothetical protein